VQGLLDTLEAAYGPGAAIDSEKLEPFLGEAGRVAPWDLTDAIDAGDTATALAALGRLTGAGGSHPLVILSVLHRHYQAMLRLDGAGVTSGEQAATLLGMRSSFPARKALEQGRRMGPARLGRAITLLAEADLDVRGRSALPDGTVLEVLVGRLSRSALSGRRRPVAVAAPRPGDARRDRRRRARYFLVLTGSCSPALAAWRMRRDLRFEAWFLWITPWAAARSMRRTAIRMASAVSSVPASMALTAVLVRVRISERTDLFLSRRRSFWRLRLIWLLMLAT
jgi:hypothetical protein